MKEQFIKIVELLQGKVNPDDVPILANRIYDIISEGYVEKAKYDEAVRQRDELREALKEIAECKGAYSMDRLEHATTVIKEAKAIAESAIKNTQSNNQ